MAEQPRIKVTPNGPYLVTGNLRIDVQIIATDNTGEPNQWIAGAARDAPDRYFLCRCGNSGNKPFWDGTHSRINFDGTETASRELDRYPVTVAEGTVHLDMPVIAQITAVQLHAVPMQAVQVQIAQEQQSQETLQDNEFHTTELAAGQMKMLTVGRLTILVYNVSGAYYATDEACTHADGPLSASTVEGSTITCLLHGSCFDVTNGAVTCPPATAPLKTYPVVVDGAIGRVLVG